MQFETSCNQNAKIQYSLSPIRVRVPVETKAQRTVYQNKRNTSKTADRVPARPPAQPAKASLFDFDSRAGVDEFLLNRRGLFLVDAFFHRLRGAID